MSLLLEAISISVPEGELLEDFSLKVSRGEIVSLMGPSGYGKSVLLSFLTGHVAAGVRASGKVWLEGMEISTLPPEQRGLGILFQDDLLFPHMTVGENLMFAVPRTIRGHEARRTRAKAALAPAQLKGMFDRTVETLSGGQRSRAALMRALLAEPKAMLLDEPFTALDASLKAEMRDFVFEHLQERRMPTILVTHDLADAEAAGGPILRPWG